MDINDPSLLVWTINFEGVTPIHAKSVTWNYLNIGLIFGGILLLTLVAILVIVLVILRRNKLVAEPASDLDPSVSPINDKDESQDIILNSTDDDKG